MSPSGRPTDSMPGQRGLSTYGASVDFSFNSRRNLQRSVSEHSPISPLQSGDGTNLIDSPVSPHFRRKPTRLSAGSLTSTEEWPNQHPPEHQQTYVPCPRAGVSPRSAPPIQTTFPNMAHTVAVQSSPAWPYPIQHQEYLLPRHLSLNTVGSTPDDLEEHQNSPQRPRVNTSNKDSSTSYTSYPPPNAFDCTSESEQSWPGPSTLNALQTPVAPTRVDKLSLRVSTSRSEANTRRQSEAVDEFTSPSEFALFVEATSSLNITAIAPSNWSSSRAYPAAAPPPPSRLLAPLPPLPHQQIRSHSSPSPFLRQVTYQPSRPQLLAEPWVGLDHEDRMLVEAAMMGLGDNDLNSEENDHDLPNYAQSQAEASERQRRAAARRAQELDEAWSMARRRQG